MQREVFAELELKRKIEGHCKSDSVSPGNLHCNFLPSDLITCLYEYPLKIMCPTNASDSCCQWIYPITFGGGLLGGDSINITCKVGENCCALVTTMSYPKVYCCENDIESQMNCTYLIDSQALLCILPDPLVCYKAASYSQTQNFYLQPNSNLILLDWFTSGRYSRKERWKFSKIKTCTTVFVENNLEFRDSQQMQDTELLSMEKAMKAFNIIGTCMVIGPFLETLSASLISQIGKRLGFNEKINPEFLLAVTPLKMNRTLENCGCILKFAAVSVPAAMKKLEQLLSPVFPVIGGNPFTNK